MARSDLPLEESRNDANTRARPPVDVEPISLRISSVSSNGTCSHDKAAYLRAKLRYHFMSPCWKWHLKRRFPWKAWFQFIKIIIVTAQLILFGIERQTHLMYISDTDITFHHLFIQQWSSDEERLPYPRASGDFAVYTNTDLAKSIDFAIHQFNDLKNLSLGLFDYHDYPTNISKSDENNSKERLFTLCLNRFKACHIEPTSYTYVLDTDIENVCYDISASRQFSISEYLSTNCNMTINYCGLNYLTLEFLIHAIELKNQKPFSLPDCYHFSVKITFDNNERTGKIRVHLDSQAEFRTCNKTLVNQNSQSISVPRNLLVAFNVLVLLITMVSLVLCLRSLLNGHRLCKEVRLFYSLERRHENPLTCSELQVFYSYWFILMVITDLMVIPGTILKIGILFKAMDMYDAAGLLLGLSSLCSWISILRYLSFFRKYNLLFVTAQKAFPLVLRFLLCAFIIYCGFMFCGWIVLGPYHTKFATMTTTFETLFGLINGDDMYATYANIETESNYISLFSKVYLYSFNCLFIYVISSLVIALIIDGYDTVKQYYTDGFPKTRLQKFSEEDAPNVSSPQAWQDLTTAIEARSACFPCCFKTSRHLRDLMTADGYLAQHINGSES